MSHATKSANPPATAPAVSSGDGDFRVLASRSLALPATFSFTCYETRFDAAVVRAPEGGARMTVRGDLGTLPFTAESPTVRRYMRAVVDAGTDLPFAEITLTRTQTIAVRGTMDFATPPSPAIVAAGTAAIVVAVKPVVQLIAACRAMGRAMPA